MKAVHQRKNETLEQARTRAENMATTLSTQVLLVARVRVGWTHMARVCGSFAADGTYTDWS